MMASSIHSMTTRSRARQQAILPVPPVSLPPPPTFECSNCSFTVPSELPYYECNNTYMFLGRRTKCGRRKWCQQCFISWVEGRRADNIGYRPLVCYCDTVVPQHVIQSILPEQQYQQLC